MKRIAIIVLSLGALLSATPKAAQTPSIQEILEKAGEKIAARIDELKNLPGDPFFARSDRPIEEQEAEGMALVEKIKGLLETEGFDSPDYSLILELTAQVLLKAPDTKYAQMANWNIHQYHLIFNNATGAGDALMTYLEKYEADDFMKKEAYDKLSNFAADEREWDVALYYSEKYLTLEPDSYPRLLNKARALINLGFLEEGKHILRRVIDEDPDSVQATLATDALAELETARFDPELVAAYKKTMEIMRLVAMAAETYYLDHMAYPGSIKELYPDFLEDLTDKDDWGFDLILKLDKDKERLLIASPGSDGTFQGFDQEGSYIDLPGKDIIFAGGFPVYAPTLRRP